PIPRGVAPSAFTAPPIRGFPARKNVVETAPGGEPVKHIIYPMYLAWIAAAVAFHPLARRRLSRRARAAGYVAWGLAACAFMILASEPLDWFYEFRVGYWRAG